MTRYEKEKAMLMVLGVNVGDKVIFTEWDSKTKFEVVEKTDRFMLYTSGNGVGSLPSFYLIMLDFKVIKTLGSKKCVDMECEKCPFWENVTCIGSMGNTLYDVLEISKNHKVITNEKYEEIKKELGKELDNAKQENE